MSALLPKHSSVSGAAASLETIDFSHNNIDDAHKYVIPLADLLLCNSIHSFDVSHNNLGPVFAKLRKICRLEHARPVK